MKDPLNDVLGKAGIKVEPREATAVEQMVGSGLGGIAGTMLAGLAGAGWLGKALASLGGAIAGHMVVTHRFRMQPREEGLEDEPLPEGPR